MSYSGDQYPFYVPLFISGTEKVRITITTSNTMTKMEHHIKMRYAFAMSSFGRMFTANKISYEMRILCEEWSENIDEIPPTKDLYQVDLYFLELWKTWSLPS